MATTFSGTYTNGIALTNPISTITSTGVITNTGTSQNGNAVYGTSQYFMFVDFGSIEAISSAGSGIRLKVGGSVTGGAGAIISGGTAGVYVSGSTGNVSNLGTMQGTATDSVGIALVAGGTVSNGQSGVWAGLISGYVAGVYISGSTGTVNNFGTIFGYDVGVHLKTGGSVVNAQSGATGGSTIYGGVYIGGSLGTVTNLGSIKTSGRGSGVALTAGGTVVNGQSNSGSAFISGSTYNAVSIYGSAGTVSNFGTIQGVLLDSGGVVNNGQSGSTLGLISGGRNRNGVPAAVYLSKIGAVTNFGAITGDKGYGIFLKLGGSVNNGQGGSIGGGVLGSAVVFYHGGGTVTNLGSIAGGGLNSDSSIIMPGSGIITNGESGSAAGIIVGVSMSGPALSLTNFGTIQSNYGRSIGASLQSTAIVGHATVTNAGTISGGTAGTAVAFGGGNDRLIVAPGAVFIGKVDGGGGSNTLELAVGAGAGTLTGLGTSFVNFGSIVFDATAAWRVSSDNPTSFTGTIHGFTPADSLDLTSVTFDSNYAASVASGNVLQITENGSTYAFNLDPNQDFGGYSFHLSPDIGAGTLITASNYGPVVTELYSDILGRAPDPAGLAFWANALATGTALADVRTAFANSDEAKGDLTAIYQQVLGRDPDPGGLAAWTNYLANGGLLANVRPIFANSGEAQGDLAAIYNQVLGRAPDQGGLAAWTNYFATGGSLANVRPVLANSGEAQGDLTLIYNQVLGRDPDSGGLAAWTNYLASGGALANVRPAFAHSGEAQGLLTAIFQGVSPGARPPDQAELAGMEAQLVPPGATLSGVQPGSGFTVSAAVTSGDLVLTALATPEEFDFGGWVFGADEIAGFDPAQDAVRLSSGLAGSFASVQADMSAVAGGTLITFDASHSLTLDGVAPAGLGAANFRFV